MAEYEYKTSTEYEDEYEYYSGLRNHANTNTNTIRFWKIIRIRIQIIFGLKISDKYEYKYHYLFSTIWIPFEYRIIRSPLMQKHIHKTYQVWISHCCCPLSNIWFGDLAPHWMGEKVLWQRQQWSDASFPTLQTLQQTLLCHHTSCFPAVMKITPLFNVAAWSDPNISFGDNPVNAASHNYNYKVC